MSLTFKSLGVEDFSEGVLYPQFTTSYTFDILPDASTTTPGNAAFIVVMGSWSPLADSNTYFYTRFQDSGNNNITVNRYTSIASHTNSVRASSNKSFASLPINNWWTSHGNLDDETDFDGERHHFMFHITNNPQLGSDSDGHPMGYLHCSGTYYYVQQNGTTVMGSIDLVVRQQSTDNKVHRMQLSVSSGSMTNIRIKTYHLGAR